jgi:pimeloyl-ACP methyl ester carboxylesterase
METARVILKTIMWILIVGFLSNAVLRSISYSFYKGKRQVEAVNVPPQKLTYAAGLTGYGCHLERESGALILCFGGSGYIAYNTVGLYGADYDVPFFSVDYHGTQDSRGKMNLSSMQASAEGLYDWVKEQYPDRRIVVIGHSYGCAMAAYLASVRSCDQLYLLSGFRDFADLYNRILPIFWGPLKVFISDDPDVTAYAARTNGRVTVIGSEADRTLPSDLQRKLAECYQDADLRIFPDIEHDGYLKDERVISLIQKSLE